MNDAFMEEFYKEIRIMRSLSHPNVLQFLGACTKKPNIAIVMEYMPRGSLFKILHDKTIKLEISMIRRMMMDAARGMNYLHKSDPIIIHRDLKSHNLLVDDHWKVKVRLRDLISFFSFGFTNFSSEILFC
jgi:serine/threonine protein kinase